MKPSSSYHIPVSVLLVVLSIVPLLGGVLRLHSLAVGGDVSPDNFRFFNSPLPVILHIVSASVFCILGAFQFPQYFRNRWPNWHRSSGRALVIFGFVAASTGVWMTLYYKIPSPLQGDSLYLTRMLVGSAMSVSIVLALIFIVHRNIPLHRAWIIRAYALGQGAGTQALFFIPVMVIVGDVTGNLRDVLMISAWVINCIVAELIIRFGVRKS